MTFEKDFYPYQSLFNLLYPSEALTGDDTKDGDTFSKGWSNDSHSDKWGAGPFVVSKSSDSEVTFTPNPKWWGDKPLLDKVVLKQMEPSAAMNAFKNGEIDAVGASDAESMTSAKTVKDAYLRRSYDSGVYTLTINTKNIPLEVRKAFVQGVDRSQLQKIDFQGIEWTEKTPGSLILPQFQDGYEDNMPAESKFSTANATKTLEDAGYKKNSDGYYEKGGKVAAITYTTFSDSASTKAKATAIQKMAKTVGIKVSIDIKASNTFSDTVSSGNWDMIGLGWSASDPFGPPLTSSTAPSPSPTSPSPAPTRSTRSSSPSRASRTAPRPLLSSTRLRRKPRSCTLRSRSRTARSLSPSRRVLRTTVLQATPPARVSW